MQICAREFKCSGVSETWSLHYLTDVHLDDPDHAEDEFKARLKQIKDDPRAVWIGGGDYGSLILPGDKRFGSGGHLKGPWAEHISRLPDYYIERTVEWMQPIADKCAGIAVGNHEATIGRNFHRGVGAEVASRLGKPELYLGDRGWSAISFRLYTKVQTVKVFSYHGWSAGRLKGRKALQAERDLGAWDADIIFLGHDHQPDADLWWTENITFDSKNSMWRQAIRPRAVVNGGSWVYGDAPNKNLSKLPVSEIPGQSWLAGKNFRPQGIANPVVLMHIDFGMGGSEATNRKSRPMGFGLEVRTEASRAV